MAESFNELMGIAGHSEDVALEGWYGAQDDAANTTVEDWSTNGRDGVLTGGNTTAELSTAGPNSFLPKALALDGSADWIDLGTGSHWDVGSGVTWMIRLNRANLSTVDSIISRGGSEPRTKFTVTGSENLRVFYDGTPSDSTINSSDSIGTGVWTSIASAIEAGGDIRFHIDGVADSGNTHSGTTLVSGGTKTLAIGRDGDSSSQYAAMSWAEAVIFSRSLEDSEVIEWNDGPEAVYVSDASLSPSGSLDVGTWALPAPFAAVTNGELTYEWIVVNLAGDVIDSGTGDTATADLSAEEGNVVYLLVRTSNDGGYDVGDYATRTSGYGSAGDGYYEIASAVVAAGGISLSLDTKHINIAKYLANLSKSQGNISLNLDTLFLNLSDFGLGIIYDRLLSADTKQININEYATNLLHDKRLTTNTANIEISKNPTSILYDRILSADTKEIDVVGNIGLFVDRRMGADRAEISLASFGLDLSLSRYLSLDTKEINVFGGQADFTKFSEGTLVLNGRGIYIDDHDLNILHHRYLSLDTAHISFQDYAAFFRILSNIRIALETKYINISDYTNRIILDRLLDLSPAELNIGGAAGLYRGLRVPAVTRPISITKYDLRPIIDRLLTLTSKPILLNKNQVNFNRGIYLTLDHHAIELTKRDLDFLYQRKMVLSPKQINITKNPLLFTNTQVEISRDGVILGVVSYESILAEIPIPVILVNAN